MKALVCLSCSTIRSPRTDKTWTPCDCGQASIRWADPQAGLAQVWAADPFYVRVLGLNNDILAYPVVHGVGLSGGDATWRRLHKTTCEQSDGYLFHTDRRNCWAVLTWPGETSDVTFVPARPRAADVVREETNH